jgi:hypothetical protein
MCLCFLQPLLGCVLLQEPEGWSTLIQEVDTNPEAAAAYAFIAASIKDHGAVPEAIRLYSLALERCPCNSTYALNLAHTLELQQDLKGALQVVRDFIMAVQGEAGGLDLLGPLQLKV